MEVSPPLIAECPVNLECKVIGIQEIGDHDMFIGQVIAEHVDEEMLDENGRIQVDKLDVLCYVSGEYWSLGQKLGHHGFSERTGN
jgi:flavin reductase (DIM6/NTAB) family NADH-FMN oxidoreductase RutF